MVTSQHPGWGVYSRHIRISQIYLDEDAWKKFENKSSQMFKWCFDGDESRNLSSWCYNSTKKGVITTFITGSGAHLVRNIHSLKTALRSSFLGVLKTARTLGDPLHVSQPQPRGLQRRFFFEFFGWQDLTLWVSRSHSDGWNDIPPFLIGFIHLHSIRGPHFPLKGFKHYIIPEDPGSPNSEGD